MSWIKGYTAWNRMTWVKEYGLWSKLYEQVKVDPLTPRYPSRGNTTSAIYQPVKEQIGWLFSRYSDGISPGYFPESVVDINKLKEILEASKAVEVPLNDSEIVKYVKYKWEYFTSTYDQYIGSLPSGHASIDKYKNQVLDGKKFLFMRNDELGWTAFIANWDSWFMWLNSADDPIPGNQPGIYVQFCPLVNKQPASNPGYGGCKIKPILYNRSLYPTWDKLKPVLEKHLKSK